MLEWILSDSKQNPAPIQMSGVMQTLEGSDGFCMETLSVITHVFNGRES